MTMAVSTSFRRSPACMHHIGVTMRGAIVGMTRYVNRGHFARATLEATVSDTRSGRDECRFRR